MCITRLLCHLHCLAIDVGKTNETVAACTYLVTLKSGIWYIIKSVRSTYQAVRCYGFAQNYVCDVL